MWVGTWQQIQRDSVLALLAGVHLDYLPSWAAPTLTWHLVLWGGATMTLLGVARALDRCAGRT